jgi:hypothetical protein
MGVHVVMPEAMPTIVSEFRARWQLVASLHGNADGRSAARTACLDPSDRAGAGHSGSTSWTRRRAARLMYAGFSSTPTAWRPSSFAT